MANNKKSRKISKAMKKAWARRKAGSIPIVTNDPNIANLVNTSYTGMAVVDSNKTLITLRIHRPDGTTLEVFENQRT